MTSPACRATLGPWRGPVATAGEWRVALAREEFTGAGSTGREIAEELQISHNTVRTHAFNAMTKLHARSRAQLVAKALAGGHAMRHSVRRPPGRATHERRRGATRRPPARQPRLRRLRGAH